VTYKLLDKFMTEVLKPAFSYVKEEMLSKVRSGQCHTLLRRPDQVQTASSSVLCTGHKHLNLCTCFRLQRKIKKRHNFRHINQSYFSHIRILLAQEIASRWTLKLATLRQNWRLEHALSTGKLFCEFCKGALHGGYFTSYPLAALNIA
jgi:hypothetical protein